jgi:predicted GH43/DUF377 family glycosyl hydrolase
MKLRALLISTVMICAAMTVLSIPPTPLIASAPMVNDDPLPGNAPVPKDYEMDVLGGEFAVVGIRPQAGDDFDLEVYTDTSFSTLIDSSTTSGDAVDLVVLEKDTWTSPPTKGVRVTKGSTSYVIEMENEMDSHTTADTWTGTMDEFPGNPVLDLGPLESWDDHYVYSPSVLFDGTTYHMWYGGNNNPTRRIGYATSPDGITWTKFSGNPVLDVGSPGLWDDEFVYWPSVIFDGTTYHMWYAGGSGSSWQIGYASSSDGISWTKSPSNPILGPGPGGTWDDYWVFSPEIHFDGTVYHMWYTGYDGSIRRIGYATSTDRITWTKYPGNPVLDVGPSGSWDDFYASVPQIVIVGGTYHMVYTGHDGSTFRLGYASSTDGINWVKEPSNPILYFGPTGSWDDRHLLYPDILYDGSKLHMWYSGGDGSNIRIGYASVTDIGGWMKYSGNPVLNVGPSSWDSQHVRTPSVIFDGNKYHMWYTGFGNSVIKTGYADSTDGINWNKYSGNPVLDLGPGGSFDDRGAFSPYVLYDGTMFHLWYAGEDGSTTTRIGYASSADGINWNKYSGNPVINIGSPGSWDDDAVYPDTVIFDGATYHMWYTGDDGPTHRTGYATSPDGVTWTKPNLGIFDYGGNSNNNIVLNLGVPGSWEDQHVYRPAVLYDGSEYKMWYGGGDSSTIKTGYAESIDGINWHKYSGNPVIDNGPSGSFDDRHTTPSTILFDGYTYHNWYTANDGSTYRIGYATSTSVWAKFTARSEVLDAYEITGLNSGSSYTIDLEVPSTADLDMFIYDSTGGRDDAVVSSTNIGSGFAESIAFTAPSSGDYLLVITNENGGSGEYTIRPGSSPPPVADAGEDQTVDEGGTVILEGSGSKAGGGLVNKEGLVSYWKFDEGIGDTAFDFQDGNDGEVHGSLWITGQVNDALQFDGYNDYVDCGDDNSLKTSGSLTVETWVKYSGYTGASGTGIFPNIVSNADYALSSHKHDWKGFFLSSVRNYPDPSRNGKIRFSVLNPNEGEQIQSPGKYDDGKWHYIAGVFEPSSHISLFVDGEMVASRSTTFSSFTPGTFPLSIGRGSENDVYHYFGGSIDEVAIYERALNQDEIRCHYNNSLLGKGYFEGSCGSPKITSYEWDFDSDGIFDYQETPYSAPDGTFDGKTTHIYGDNGDFVATLRVTDETNQTDTDTCNITVLNVDPTTDMESPTMDVEISLRMAGSKWSNAEMTLYEEDQAIGFLEVERWPGNPDNNPTNGDPVIPVSLDLTKNYSAIVTYDPYPDSGDAIRGDQPNNGKDKQNNAGNPVWVVVRFPNGSEERAHHTFNTQQSKKRGSTHPILRTQEAMILNWPIHMEHSWFLRII